MLEFMSTVNGLDLMLIALLLLSNHYRRYWKRRATRYYIGDKY